MSEKADRLEQAAVERLNRADRLTLRALAAVLVVLLLAGWFAFVVFAAQGDLEHPEVADQVEQLVARRDELAQVTESCP